MVVSEKVADDFMEAYKAFLLYAYNKKGSSKTNCDLLEKLSIGREQYLKNRSLLNDYNKKNKIKLKIYKAIKSLEVDNWIYLRDTTKYSIFLKGDMTVSYAVLGLTQPIKEIFGYSGLYLKTGLISLENNFVCDGLLSNIVELGKNYKSEFNENFKELKETGWFYKTPKT